MQADKIIKNAKIFTSDKDNLQASALAVKDGKFVYVGDEAGLSDFEGEDFICISGEKQNLDFTTSFLKGLNGAGVSVHTIMRTDNIDSAFLMIDADMGVTVLPEYFQGRFYGSSQIRTAYFEENLPLTDYMAVWTGGRPSWELAAFLEYAGYVGE